MEDTLRLALTGIYSLLLMSLTFNFVLAVKLNNVKGRVEEVERRSIEEARIMEERLIKIKEDILHRKGLVM